MIHSASQIAKYRERERESYWVNLNKDQRERETFITLESHFQWDKERETEREKEREIRNTLSWAPEAPTATARGELSTGGLELSRSICNEGRDYDCDCDRRDCDCDLLSTICDLR